MVIALIQPTSALSATSSSIIATGSITTGSHTPNPAITINTLPTDILEKIASTLPPTSIPSFALTSPSLSPTTHSPTLWRTLHSAHFPRTTATAHTPPPLQPSSVTFAAAAATHAGRWNISTAALLPDTPVYMRRGAVASLRAQGGRDRVSTPDARTAYYVVPADDRGPARAPGSQIRGCVEVMMRAAQTVAAGGVIVRVVHGMQGGTGRVEVSVNGASWKGAVGAGSVGQVGVGDVWVPPGVLREGKVNLFTVSYVGEPGVVWWLREVEIISAVIGMKKWNVAMSESLPVPVPRRQSEDGNCGARGKSGYPKKIRTYAHPPLGNTARASRVF